MSPFCEATIIVYGILLGILGTKTSSVKRSIFSSLLGSLGTKNSNDKRGIDKRSKCTFSCKEF